MYLYGTPLGIIFFSQISLGVLGNSFLFFYGLTLVNNCRSKPMDPILMQLTFSNTLLLLFRGCPLVIINFGKGYSMEIIDCKMIFYIERVSRGLSISTTCFLSVFQAVVISPSTSRLAKLKARVQQYIRPSCVLCWIINLILEIPVPTFITGSRISNSSHRDRIDLLYCHWEKVIKEITMLPTLRDILFIGCMLCSSSYMVFLLYRHSQRVQHIHSTRLSPRTSPEMKATQTILLLVGLFIFSYCLSCGLMVYSVYLIPSGSWVTIVSTFTTSCFPTISPFLVIHRNTLVSMSCCVLSQRPRPHSGKSSLGMQVYSSSLPKLPLVKSSVEGSD